MNFWHEDTSKWSDVSMAQDISQFKEDEYGVVRASL